MFLFIRANREPKINLMISALKELVYLFFAFDHYNYARWITLFNQVLILPKSVKEELETGRFIINRSCHRSSSLPIDHAQVPMNKIIKGVRESRCFHRKSSNIREMDGSWPRTIHTS